MELTDKEKYYLGKCFSNKEVKKIALKEIGTSLAKDALREIENIPVRVRKHIHIETLEKKIIEECLLSTFKLDNLGLPIILEFFLIKFQDYKHYEKEYRRSEWTCWGDDTITYKGKDINIFDYDYKFLCSITESCLYYPNYEEARKELRNVKIEEVGFGRFSKGEIIREYFMIFKPIALSIADKLTKLNKSKPVK